MFIDYSCHPSYTRLEREDFLLAHWPRDWVIFLVPDRPGLEFLVELSYKTYKVGILSFPA